MLNKRIIIDLNSPKVKKNILITFGVLIVLIVALVYSLAPDVKAKPETVNQISTSEGGIESSDEKKSSIYVDVSGAVKDPSVILLAEGSRVFEAIEAAGGLTEDANLTEINRAEIVEDGSYIYIPTNKEIENNTIPSANGDDSGATGSGQGKININTADSTELQQLNGVGPATAEKIIAYRNSNGRFNNIEEIKNVSGIGDKTYEKLAPDIKI